MGAASARHNLGAHISGRPKALSQRHQVAQQSQLHPVAPWHPGHGFTTRAVTQAIGLWPTGEELVRNTFLRHRHVRLSKTLEVHQLNED